MAKTAAAVAALAVTLATVAMGSPAAATDYVQTVDSLNASDFEQTYWRIVPPSKFETPYTAIGGAGGTFDLGSFTLDPGDMLTVDVMFNNPPPFPPGPECCHGIDYQVIAVVTSHNAPLGVVTRYDGGLLTNPDGYVTGASIFFSAAPYYPDGVPIGGDYTFDMVPLPEPGSWSLAILGVGFVGTALRLGGPARLNRFAKR